MIPGPQGLGALVGGKPYSHYNSQMAASMQAGAFGQQGGLGALAPHFNLRPRGPVPLATTIARRFK